MTRRNQLASWSLAIVLAAIGMAAGVFLFSRNQPVRAKPSMTSSQAALRILHPIEGAVMPANMPAPALLWTTNDHVRSWTAEFQAGDMLWRFEDIKPVWRPSEAEWLSLKTAAEGKPIRLNIYPSGRAGTNGEMASVRFRVAAEPLVTPFFYREVNLPFSEAVKDPSKIRWRFGPLDNPGPPPIVLENLPVCGNCHSFSRKGEFLAMDVDYANSKASYVITKTAPEMRLATSDVITWNDYKREDGQQTFGLLSQISPDGRYVLSTVKDRSVFVPRPNLAFSQLFFPLKGIIAVYDREEKRFFALPGADDPAFVQSNPTWSPDGKVVVFARNRAAELEHATDTGRVLLTPEECEEFLKRGKEFKFDLYRVAFNEGRGGRPEPLRGASANGRSNYFPKFSPDGKWIVFCQASNYMLLQPDSDLFIIPAEGGEARKLGCNLGRMNSWHSWSPDGCWLVFSSKAHSDYTQLYLSRINQQGEASPPVWLAHMVESGRAANIPEIVDLPPQYIARIREQFLDDYSYVRAGNEFFRAGEADRAIEKYQQALSLNPDNAVAHQKLGFLLFRVKNQFAEGIKHTETAVRLEPRNAMARFDLGSALVSGGDLTNAVVHLAEAVRLLPNGYDRQYNAVDMNYGLGETCYCLKRFADAIPPLQAVLQRQPNHPRANYLLAMAKAWLGETDSTRPYHAAAVQADPSLSKLPDYYDLLSNNYTRQGRYADGLAAAELGFRLATEAGRPDQAARLRQRADDCRSRK
jgi:tetratricopeptide (TPR) repeat protein